MALLNARTEVSRILIRERLNKIPAFQQENIARMLHSQFL